MGSMFSLQAFCTYLFTYMLSRVLHSEHEQFVKMKNEVYSLRTVRNKYSNHSEQGEAVRYKLFVDLFGTSVSTRLVRLLFANNKTVRFGELYYT